MRNNQPATSYAFHASASLDGDGRIKWIDTAKAVGLYLVFWGHLLYGGSAVASVINRVIYSFHMPMFFILSGFVFKNDSLTFNEFFKTKFFRILLPAVILYLLTLPIYFLSLDYSSTSFRTIILTVFYLNGRCAYNEPVWFFICLFQVLVFVKIARLSTWDNKRIALVLLASLLLSFGCYASDWKVFRFLGFNKFLLGLFFFTLGYFLKKDGIYNKAMTLIGVIALPVWLLTGVVFNSKVSMYQMSLGNFWHFVISGCFGSLVFFAFCKIIEENRRIRQYAKWTIFIVCSHYVLVTLFFKFSSLSSVSGTLLFDLSSFVFVILAFLIYKPICQYLSERHPVLLGLCLCKK